MLKLRKRVKTVNLAVGGMMMTAQEMVGRYEERESTISHDRRERAVRPASVGGAGWEKEGWKEEEQCASEGWLLDDDLTV